MLKLLVNNFKGAFPVVCKKVTTYAKEVEDAKESTRISNLLKGDPDYDLYEGSPIILSVKKRESGKELFWVLATLWFSLDKETLPIRKITERGLFLDIISKEERVEKGWYGNLVEEYVKKERFALITTKDFWRCRCPEMPVKAVEVDRCPFCETEKGTVKHGLRLIDNMI